MARKRKKSQDSKRRRTNRKNNGLEYEIMEMMEACLKTAINKTLDDLFREGE